MQFEYTYDGILNNPAIPADFLAQLKSAHPVDKGIATAVQEKLTTLVAPDMITIPQRTFINCLLTSLTLPQVKTIGGDAFENSLLTSLTLPLVETIEYGAFENSLLTSLTLPLVKTIGDSTFYYSPLTSLTLPLVETIGELTFKNSLLTSLTLPLVKTIGATAFDESKLTSLTLPLVKTIGANAFDESKLTSITLPQVETIGNGVFYHSLLTSLNLPQVETIGDSAFGSSLLTSLTLPQVKTIGAGAFGSSLLTSLTLPQVKTIGANAFGNSPLTSLTLPLVKTIDMHAFEQSSLTSLTLPLVETIGERAFYYSPLTSLTLPLVKTIDKDAFVNIINLKTTFVDIPPHLQTNIKKDEIFGVGAWDKITFKYYPPSKMIEDLLSGNPMCDPGFNGNTLNYTTNIKPSTFLDKKATGTNNLMQSILKELNEKYNSKDKLELVDQNAEIVSIDKNSEIYKYAKIRVHSTYDNSVSIWGVANNWTYYINERQCDLPKTPINFILLEYKHNKQLHSPQSWDVSIGEFESGDWGNTIGTFKTPATHVENFMVGDVFNKAKAFYNLAQTYIDAIVSQYKDPLNYIKIGWITNPQDKRFLKECIYEAVQHAVLNRDVWEKVNGSSVNAGGLSVSNNPTGWLLNINMFGKRGINKLNLSEISKYKVIDVGDAQYQITKADGNIEIVGKFDETKIKELL